MRRIYIASSWRNEYQPKVVKWLKKWGHEVYDFRNPPGKAGFKWSDIEDGWKNWSRARYRHLLTTSPEAAHGFIADLRGMLWADTCVMVLPCGRSACLEAGYMARDKRLVIYMPQEEEPDLMFLLAHHICLYEGELHRALR